MNKTNIEWVKNPDGSQGFTWNPITGCLNGCPYCYARQLANGRLRERYLANKNLSNKFSQDCFEFNEQGERKFNDPFYPRFWPERLMDKGLEQMIAPIIANHEKYTRQQKGIFTCDMSDLFGIGVPEEWTKTVLRTIQCSPHRFYLLTKQPQNLTKFSPFPDNCWVGFSATNNDMWWDGLHYFINHVTAKVKFVSFEPLQGELYMDTLGMVKSPLDWLDWVIIGAQTKPYNPPKIEWVKEIVEAADSAGVPVFLKNNLYDLFMSVPHDDLFWEDMSNLIQEMPK